MSSTQYIYIPNRVIDSNGISDGATIDFFLQGTTTRTPAYSDDARTTPIANPYTVGAGAAVPVIYLDPEVTYRIRVLDSDGNTIKDESPYGGIPASAVLTSDGDTVEEALSTASDRVPSYATLAALKAATTSISNGYAIYDSRIFRWTLGDYSGQSDDVEVIKANASPLTTGAWVAQGVTLTESTTGTRFKRVVINGEDTVAVWPHICIDPVNGDDGNDGFSWDSPIKTSTGLMANGLFPPGLSSLFSISSFGTGGTTGTGGVGTYRINNSQTVALTTFQTDNGAIFKGSISGTTLTVTEMEAGEIESGDSPIVLVRYLTIAIKGSDQITRDQFQFIEPNAGNGFRVMDFCSFVRFEDTPVKLDCTDIATAGDWTPHATYANCYEIDWDHAMLGAETARARIFMSDTSTEEGWVPLKRRETEAEIETLTDSDVGEYFQDGDPAAGTPLRLVAHFAGNYDPRTGSKTVEITARDYCIAVRDNCLVQGIFGYRNGSNNGSFYGRYNCDWRGLLMVEGTKHNWVAGNGTFQYVLAVNCYDDEFPSGASNVPVMGTNYANIMDGRSVALDHVAMFADKSAYNDLVECGGVNAQAYYTHDADDSGAADLTATNCWSANLYSGWVLTLASVWNISDFFCIGQTGAVPVIEGSPGGNKTLTRSLMVDCKRGIQSREAAIDRLIWVTSQTISGGALFAFGGVAVNWTVSNSQFVSTVAQSNAFIAANGGGGGTAGRLTVTGTGFANSAYPNQLNTFGSGGIYSGVGNVYDLPTSFDPNSKALYVNNTAYTVAGAKSANLENAQTVGDVFGYVSGTLPNVTTVDIRLATDGDLYTVQTAALSQAEVNAFLALPRTLAAAKPYVIASPVNYTVLTA